ncbi:MAG: outer membrane protein assembly factor BamA [Bacteroidales bacterium]|jgi:outer membrane protein insertion porin family|nr:outer membrane protein assembly factor BamA [Bacteroidales bacterium]
MQSTKLFLITLFIVLLSQQSQSQVVLEAGSASDIELNYVNPAEYEIGGITFSGTAECDVRTLYFAVGEKIKIPGEKIRKTIDRLAKSGLYKDNIRITANNISGKIIFLDIYLEEANRLSSFVYTGVKKSDIEEFNKKLNLSQGKIVNENLKIIIKNVVTDYYKEKGFYFASVEVVEQKDTSNPNFVILNINVDKGRKVKVEKIIIHGAQEIDGFKLRAAMKETKTKFLFQPFEKVDSAIIDFFKNHDKYKGKDLGQLLLNYYSERVRVRFKTSKYDQLNFEKDKNSLIKKYNEFGYRDAYIVSDTVYFISKRAINIDIYVNEGRKYYFRNITWVGNSKYSSEILSQILNIKKGDVYNTTLLETNLNMSQDNMDVSSLYLDDGYLFFYALPIEINVEGDSVDIEIRIREGIQATINKVTVSGNTRTSDNVILRELVTVPGRKFSRSDIIRSQRQLLQFGFFNQEKMNVIPTADEKTGTVNLEYVVEESSSDQLQLSVGWGANLFYGQIGFAFNNFSARKFFKKGAWTPVPSGDGQKLAFNVQVYSNAYQYYSASFTEPWLGGKKPIALTVGVSHSLDASTLAKTDASYYKLQVTNFSVGISNRLKVPDDYFYMSNMITYRYYDSKNYTSFILATGIAHSISYTFSLGRNSTDAAIYPRTGSDMIFSVQLTPPYSSFNNKNYADLPLADKYRWLEYHKWKINISQYINIVENLVLNIRARFGFLGMYNQKVGASPFERFYMGGSGLTSTYMIDAREIVSMRGYTDEAITPDKGGTVFQKMTFELRYPITLNPSATIFLLTFLEAGNNWKDMRSYKPFEMYRAAGVGVRVYLPMFGLLGLDWGYGFDAVPGNPNANKSQFHFSIGQSIE